MIKKGLKNIILIITFINILSYSYAEPINTKRLLDIGVLIKKDGKAILLVFDKAVNKKEWKIKFNNKKLDIILFGFTSNIKKDELNINNIPAIDNFYISKENNNIKISLILKEDIKTLLQSGSLTFLTNNPYTLGIMFTKSFLDNFVKNNFKHEIIKKENKKIIKNDLSKENKVEKYKKKTSENSITQNNTEMPFIKYEDIFATNTGKQSLNKSSKQQLKKKEKTKKEAVHKKEKMGSKNIFIKKSNAKINKKEFIKKAKEESSIELVKIIGSLSAVLGIVIISLLLWKKLLLFRYKGNQELIKILGVHHFGSRQSIAVIQIGKEKFLVGITTENINLLTKLNNINALENAQKISEHNLSEEDTLSQRAVSMLKERFNQLKRI